MASRASRYMSNVLRSSSRSTLRTTPRRAMSSHASTAKQSSDTPWIIGSALIFGPALAWCLSQSGKSKDAHHEAHSKHEPKHEKEEVPVKDSEGTEASAAEVSESVDTAVETDSPKEAQATEEQPQEPEPQSSGGITDADGETVSAVDIKESTEQAIESDSPKEAQAVEETEAKEAEKEDAPKDEPKEEKQEEKANTEEPTESK